MIAKYFATSFAIENVVNAPRVINSCLPISTTSISFVGLLSRSTMLPASFAACVPVFIATPTSAWANAGASLVPSPVIATSLPPSCSRLMSAILSSGVACGEKVVDTGFARDRCGSERIVAGDHHRLDPHLPHLIEALNHSALDDVFQLNHTERDAIFRDDERRATCFRDVRRRCHSDLTRR